MMEKLRALIPNTKEGLRRLYAFLAVCAVAAYYAHANYFIQDDAYIAFVYAKNFASGHGLVWYPGSTEYGYTSFLYTLTVGLFMLTGLHPEPISAGINFCAYIACIALAYRFTLLLCNSRLVAICATLAMATHHTFSAYASGGLETMVVTAFIAGFYYLLAASHLRATPLPIWPIAALASLALLTRLDASLLLFPGYLWMAAQHGFFTKPLQALRSKSLWIVTGVPVLGVCALLVGAATYYGYALPNTFYAKIPSGYNMAWLGWRYLHKYLSLHEYIPLASTAVLLYGLLILRSTSEYRKVVTVVSWLILVLTLWLAYTVYVGGDFMEFRLLVPLIPLFYPAVFSVTYLFLARNPPKTRWPLFALVLLSLLGNSLHAERFQTRPGKLDFVDFTRNRDGFPIGIIEPIDGNYDWVNIPRTNWRIIGKSLHKLFYQGRPDDVKIATINPGAIAYYSGLPIMDTTGLNTRDAIKYSRHFVYRPGHQRIAKNFLYDKLGNNLTLATPQTFCERNGYIKWMESDVRAFVAPPRKRMIFIPLGNSCYVAADYRISHPKIEELLANDTILDYKKHKQQIKCPPWICHR